MKTLLNKLNTKFSKFSLALGLFLAIAAVASGMLIPKFLLNKKSKSQMSVVTTAPEDYYLGSGTAMARKASEQLSSLDRIKLVSGAWGSISSKCDTSEGFLGESAAVNLAKEQLEHFYDANVYPYSLSSTYGNWYSWSTELYQYTDTVFNTYTTYLWVIKFTKFDNSLTHTILMTENGTIVNAEVSNNSTVDPKEVMVTTLAFRPEKLVYSRIINAYKDFNVQYVLGENTRIRDSEQIDSTTLEIPYPYVDTSTAVIKNFYKIVLSEPSKDDENYYIYQYTTNNSYCIGIISE